MALVIENSKIGAPMTAPMADRLARLAYAGVDLRAQYRTDDGLNRRGLVAFYDGAHTGLTDLGRVEASRLVAGYGVTCNAAPWHTERGPVRCALPIGHGGDHRNAEGKAWRQDATAVEHRDAVDLRVDLGERVAR
jgi:hypothetical protein